MIFSRRRHCLKRITFATLQICAVLAVLIFIVFPIIFSYSLTLQRGILFLTFITYPRDLDLSNPASVGLYGTRSFHITFEDNDIGDDTRVKIGVWQVLPEPIVKRFKRELKIESEFEKNEVQAEEEKNKELDAIEPIIKSKYPEVTKENEHTFYEQMLKVPGTVVIYLHGNTASRGSGHRTEIYKILRKLGYHVLSLDYRGYGDSDPISPSEEGVVKDALAVFNYIRNITSSPIIIWGHSLGTGVATHMCSQLSHLKESGPRAVILEAPFTNIMEEIRLHPFAKLFKYLPWFDSLVSKPMYKNSLRFESDKHVSEFRAPIMIIHAEDDYVVPFRLGHQLFRIAVDTRAKSWGPVEFHRFPKERKYGHKYLCRAPELPKLVEEFVNNYRDVVY